MVRMLIVCAVFVHCCCLEAGGQVTTSFEINKTEFLVGEPIQLKTVIRNYANSAIKVGVAEPSAPCNPYFFSTQGFNEHHEGASRQLAWNNVQQLDCLERWVTLESGQEWTETIYLNSLTGLDRPGPHNVYVERRLATTSKDNSIQYQPEEKAVLAFRVNEPSSSNQVSAVLAPYISALESPDAKIRQDAAFALSQSSSLQLETVFEKMIKKPEFQTDAIAGLRKLNLDSSRRTLFQFIVECPTRSTNCVKAINSLATSGDGSYAIPLLSIAHTGQANFGPLLCAASRLGGEMVSEKVGYYLHDKNPEIRAQAIAAIAENSSGSSLRALVESLRDPSYSVRAVAASYLARLTHIYPGQDGLYWSGTDPNEDLQFWESLISHAQGKLKVYSLAESKSYENMIELE